MLTISRRACLAATLSTPLALPFAAAAASSIVPRSTGTRLRIGLNAFSFNKPLLAGKMSISQLLEYCARHNFDGLDLTGYYFLGYPKVPSDERIYEVKRAAFQNGVSIIGTGVRNDFALTDASSLRGHIQLVKDWIEVAAKLGGNTLRVFSGKERPRSHSYQQVLDWMIPAFAECAEHGKKHGVIVGLQQHHDFLLSAQETIDVVKAVNSDWFSVILDVGSLRQVDPYAEIEKLLPYASNWQLKEHVWYGEKKVEIDLPRLRKIIDKVGYRGFIPIEALGEGDPGQIVAAFLQRVRAAFS